MDVHIGEIQATIVDSGDASSAVSPETLQRIVRAVVEALERKAMHDRRRAADQKVDSPDRSDLERFG